MIRKIFFAAASFVFILTVSCEDGFSPKGDLKEIYVLNCILIGDTTIQYATLSKSYDVSGYDPFENKIDPSVVGSLIKIFKGDTVFTMRDTTLPIYNRRYGAFVHCYYVKNLKTDQFASIRIEAILPNGKILKGIAKPLKFQYIYFYGSDDIIPPPQKPPNSRQNHVELFWEESGINTTDKPKLFFVPKLEIKYWKRAGNNLLYKSKDIPQIYVMKEGVLNPVFPKGTFDKFLIVEMNSVKQAMTEISEGDPNKSNYIIDKAILTLLVLNEDLSTYYSSTEVFFDQPTIKLHSPDYSNIEGGKGIFGIYIKREYQLKIDDNFIKSFGYR